jgi:hypothetical protein
MSILCMDASYVISTHDQMPHCTLPGEKSCQLANKINPTVAGYAPQKLTAAPRNDRFDKRPENQCNTNNKRPQNQNALINAFILCD